MSAARDMGGRVFGGVGQLLVRGHDTSGMHIVMSPAHWVEVVLDGAGGEISVDNDGEGHCFHGIPVRLDPTMPIGDMVLRLEIRL